MFYIKQKKKNSEPPTTSRSESFKSFNSPSRFSTNKKRLSRGKV